MAIVGIAQGFAVGIRASGFARTTTTAVSLARAKLAELEAGLLPVTADADGDFTDLGEPDFQWKLTRAASAEHPGLYELTLRIDWPDRGETRDLTVVRWMLDRQAGTGPSTPQTTTGTK